MIDPQAKANEVYERGFCVLEGVFTPDERLEMQRIMDDHWNEHGSPALADWGFGISPVATKTPELMKFYAKAEIVATLKAVLHDEVRLVHTGARMSAIQGASAIGWHAHYGGWDESALATREKIERVLIAIYVEGSSRAVGPLVVLPRGHNEPLMEWPADLKADLPGQIKVEATPGAVVIFDTTLMHNAHVGNQPGTRHLFGAHLQGWSETRSHPEDNPCDVPEIAHLKATNPILRALVEAPVTT